jgi:hypothetical protein
MYIEIHNEQFKFAVSRPRAVTVDRELIRLLPQRLLSVPNDYHECQEQAQHSPDLPIAHHRASPLFGPLRPGFSISINFEREKNVK